MRIAGEVDLTSAEKVADAARTAIAGHPREVHLDMAAVSFLDSSGIRILLQAQREATEREVVLRVVNAHRRVTKVLAVTGVLHLLQDGTSPA